MKAVSCTEDTFKAWDEFCDASDDAWFWHTSHYLKYILKFKLERRSVSKSFFVTDDYNQVVALCPLFLERDGEGNIFFSFGGDFNPNPCLVNSLTLKQREKILDFIFQHVDSLAHEHAVQAYNVRISILAENSFQHPYNYLLRDGFIGNTINTKILDLSISRDELWRALNHGHQQNIKKYQEQLTVLVHSTNCPPETIEQYRLMHQQAAGRATRPAETFVLMYRWLKEAAAMLLEVRQSQSSVGFFLFAIYKNKAYYASSVTHPDFNNIPVGHRALWEGMQYLADQGVHYLEIGWQQEGDDLFRLITEKERRISYFKKGFGGFTRTIFEGIKFYDRSLVAKTVHLG